MASRVRRTNLRRYPWIVAKAFASMLVAACDSGGSSQSDFANTAAAQSATASAARQTPAPTPRPTSPPAAATQAPVKATGAAPAAPAAFNYCGAPANPWHYNFCNGNVVYGVPSDFCNYFPCIPSFWNSTKGYAEECVDGKYSHSGGRPGACSYHNGELRPVLSP